MGGIFLKPHPNLRPGAPHPPSIPIGGLRGGSERSHLGISLGGWNAFETQRVQWGKAWVTWLESVGGGGYLVNPMKTLR